MRVKITLACTETGDRNYITTKNKRNNPDRIELMKYSPRLKNILCIEKRNKERARIYRKAASYQNKITCVGNEKAIKCRFFIKS